ncbi:MAG TPA: OsmC family protein [Longimicrobiales bacterium]|nr:OsmC family protein [Longimicrobiales bacterium]
MARTTTRQAKYDVTARQEPLRERYRHSPGDALITDRGRTVAGALDDALHAWAVPGSQDYGVEWELGIHAAVGGLHDGPNPGDLLCLALASCMDSVIRMIANRHGVVIERLEVDVTGDVDVRGTLWVTQDVRVGFQRMRCMIHLETADGTDPELVQRLLAASERSCVNLDTLREGVEVAVDYDLG